MFKYILIWFIILNDLINTDKICKGNTLLRKKVLNSCKVLNDELKFFNFKA
jgi:hypothetical protein